MDSSTVLVVGATGKQGRALLSALMANPNPPPVLALTRNVASASAQGLKKQYEGSNFDLVQGDSSKPAAIFASRPKGSVRSLFMYTIPPMSKKDPSETSQAMPLIDAAVAHGVQHIVFSSVERGGNEESWDNPCEHIEHFHQKHLIELHLRDKAVKEGSFSWTILRPVAFMDNLQPGLFGSLFASMWNSMLSPETKLQLVATSDIGVWAADAVVEPSSPRFRNQAIALAGDELSLREVKDVFRKCVGKDLPQSMGLLGKALIWWLTEVGNMLRWFETNGFGADIGTIRKQHSMLTLDDWLRQESQWKDRSAS